MSSALDRLPSSFLRQLPKAELHLHLEGAIDPATLLELRQRRGDRVTRAEVDQLYLYNDFQGFLLAFKNITEHLRTAEDYELITYRLMQRLKEENVLHAEVYVSVGVCLWRKQDFSAIFEGLDRGRARGARDFGISLLWIFDAVRQFGAEAAQNVFELAVRYHDREVVGIGIGGDELKAPPELFRDAYAWAADHGMRLTAHAGETGPPESVWERSTSAPSASATVSPPSTTPTSSKSLPSARFRSKSASPATSAPALSQSQRASRKNLFRPGSHDHAQQR